MADFNTGRARRFAAGGKIQVNDPGVTTGDWLVNISEGGVNITGGGYEAVEYHSEDIPQQPLVGKRQYTEITVTAQFVGADTESLMKKFEAAQNDGSDCGLVKEYDLIIQWPDCASAAFNVAAKCTLANCYLVGKPSLQTGTEWDEVTFTMRGRVDPVWADA